MHLFCLPNAGGSAYTYSKWGVYFREVTVVPIEYSGHGKLYDKKYWETFDETVKKIYSIIGKECDFNNYCVFGHSMGGILGFELYHLIRKNNSPIPECLFFAATCAPSDFRKNRINWLTDNMLLRRMVRTGGVSKDLVSNTVMKKMILRSVRNDYNMMNTYEYNWDVEKIESQVVLLNGDKDKSTLKGIKNWEMLVNGNIHSEVFSGDHFFIRKNEVIEYINNYIFNIINKEEKFA